MMPAEQAPRPRKRDNVHYLETEFATRVRFMVISLAKREAREAIKRKLRAEGTRPHSLTLSEINRLANEYLKAHAAELLAQAERSGVVQRLMREDPARLRRATVNALPHGRAFFFYARCRLLHLCKEM